VSGAVGVPLAAAALAGLVADPKIADIMLPKILMGFLLYRSQVGSQRRRDRI
jgi:hypothetical protein